MVPANPAIGPVRGGERINTLDVVRGFALLGILLMNIPTFGFVQAAYANPNIQGGNDLLNRWVLTVIYLFGEGKMRAIFSLMFGAGTLLFISRAEERGAGIRAADLYVRRCLWLMLFGMLHAYLIWWGDILYPYGLLGLSLFVFRVMTPKRLTVIAAAMFVFMTVGSVMFSWEQKKKLDAYHRIQAMDLESAALTGDQKKELDEGIKLMENLYPSQKKIQEELDAYRGNYAANLKKRGESVWAFHALPYYFPFLWDMAAMMFLGLAFLKSGVLTGDRSPGFYKRMLIIGGILGLTLNGATMWIQWRHNFDPVRGLFDGIAYEVARVPMALSYIGGLILVVKAGKMAWLTSRLAAVGQMAFSNYISHSLICSILFYGGYGFGLIGKLERWQLYPIVLAIWIFNLAWSPIWLRHHHFGPLEWCWRSLTYWKRQPMRIRAPQPEFIEPAPQSAAIETGS